MWCKFKIAIEGWYLPLNNVKRRKLPPNDHQTITNRNFEKY